VREREKCREGEREREIQRWKECERKRNAEKEERNTDREASTLQQQRQGQHVTAAARNETCKAKHKYLYKQTNK
jgi:hypothetical protein